MKTMARVLFATILSLLLPLSSFAQSGLNDGERHQLRTAIEVIKRAKMDSNQVLTKTTVGVASGLLFVTGVGTLAGTVVTGLRGYEATSLFLLRTTAVLAASSTAGFAVALFLPSQSAGNDTVTEHLKTSRGLNDLFALSNDEIMQKIEVVGDRELFNLIIKIADGVQNPEVFLSQQM